MRSAVPKILTGNVLFSIVKNLELHRFFYPFKCRRRGTNAHRQSLAQCLALPEFLTPTAGSSGESSKRLAVTRTSSRRNAPFFYKKHRRAIDKHPDPAPGAIPRPPAPRPNISCSSMIALTYLKGHIPPLAPPERMAENF